MKIIKPLFEMQFLIVDDNPLIRAEIRHRLNENGFCYIEEAEDGAMALDMMINGAYDFVITDDWMPNMSGVELIGKARKNPVLKKKPMLLVLEEVNKETVIAAAKSGASGFIGKPINAKILGEKINKIINTMLL